MALPDDYKKLYAAWRRKLNPSGDPKLDALIDIEGALSNFESPVLLLLSMIGETNNGILQELKLLNCRFEEMAETHINKSDIEGT